MAKRDDRLAIAPLGEYYSDALTIEAWLKSRTASVEANSLLCSALQRRKEYRDEAIAYLAQKRGVSTEKLIEDILTGKAEKLTSTEYARLIEDRQDSVEE